jgi:hypothetical protein
MANLGPPATEKAQIQILLGNLDNFAGTSHPASSLCLTKALTAYETVPSAVMPLDLTLRFRPIEVIRLAEKGTNR